jgi:hypothetical protein
MDDCPFLHDILCTPTSGYASGLSPPLSSADHPPLEEVEHFPALSSTTATSSTPVRSGPTFLEVLRKNTATQGSGSGGKAQPKAGGGGDKAGGEEWRRSRRVGKRVLEGLWAMGGADLRHTYTEAREAAATAARAR